MAPTVPVEFTGQKESKKCWLSSQHMGKSRKYSKGLSSGFVPDYRHAVDTVDTVVESEGFESSVRVDTEMAASEDSYAPKRKCTNFDLIDHDSFSIPMQVLSLSRMSKSERKNLEQRLKKELEQVRVLRRKVASLGSNAAILSPSSDIRSCSDGLKRPPLEGLHRSCEVSAPQSRKRAPPGRNGARTKKTAHGRSEQAKLAAPAIISNAMLMKQCNKLLNTLMDHKYAWVFNEPVDVVRLKIPDYFTIIRHPMDLGTVRSRMNSGLYSSPQLFAADVRLTFANAMKYNPPGNDVHVMAETLGKFFESKWKGIENKLPATVDVQSEVPGAAVPVEMETKVDSFPVKKKKIAQNDGTVMSAAIPVEMGTKVDSFSVKKKKIAQNDSMVMSEPVRLVMTNEEKHKLSTELEALLGELPEKIIDFLKEHSHNNDGEDEIEIDIDALGDDTLFKLRKLLDDYMLEKRKNQAKVQPCEVEVPNESGFGNFSLETRKVDEDIDIVGGNNPPLSSYPPVEIEKDAAHKNSSSSSSSESGSSSDDSDSGSSGGESDAIRAQVPCNITKENVGTGEIFDDKKSDIVNPDIGNQSPNGLIKVESNSQEPTTIKTDGHQEGENAPPDRQVSPDKAYRAAILRNRFADTILKAREKALEKGEKRDPEKLRMEREELERRQKEEKARLQAEAKAAEEAQRKAAAEAAAEAKRQRELEREAARKALQQMEKTVDINENSQFMEDLEMLRVTHDEEMPTFMEETSPDFMLQGSNPLEQLGLYMKKDDEEEEDVEQPQNVSESVKDVEEGEID